MSKEIKLRKNWKINLLIFYVHPRIPSSNLY